MHMDMYMCMYMDMYMCMYMDMYMCMYMCMHMYRIVWRTSRDPARAPGESRG